MDTLCDLTGENQTCPACGFRSAFRGAIRVCDASPKPGLGDMVAGALEAVGITKERVSAAMGRDCGCTQRQEALNELGRRFGIG